MSAVLIEDLDPIILEKLEILAQQYGRTLQEEVKYILQQAAENEGYYHKGGEMTEAREAIARSQARYAGKTFSDSAELIREDRQR